MSCEPRTEPVPRRDALRRAFPGNGSRNTGAFIGVVAAGVLAAGCAHSGGTPKSSPPKDDAHLPAEITDETYAEARRTLRGLPLDAARREELRNRLVGYLDRKTAAVVATEEYDAVVEHFRNISALYRPEEFTDGKLPQALERPAQFLMDHAAPRGDEGRTLAALLAMRELHRDEPRYAEEYRRVAEWGQRAREGIQSALDRYTQLISVWKQHAALTPAPKVLDRLAHLHVERRNVVIKAMQGDEKLGNPSRRSMLQMGVSPHHLMQRAPFDVAAVYLKHGKLAEAMSRVEAMGDSTGSAGRLLHVLRSAKEGEHSGDALFELAEAYREARPEVAMGLCERGYRRVQGDPRFPLCLARVAATQKRYADTTAWYTEAIRLAPKRRKLYDEALSTLNRFLEKGLFQPEQNGTKRVARQAERILDARLTRWPESEPPVAPEQLRLLIGMLAMNAGHVDEARERFQASLDAKPNSDALIQLGLLEERTGHADKALRLYRRALDRTPQRKPKDALERAEILEHLGNAYEATGQPEQSERMYRQALQLWEAGSSSVEGPQRAMAEVRRGVLLDHLARHAEAVAAFRAAMRAAPQWRQSYAGILSHLVVASPDTDFALEVFRRAQRQLTLEPQWKVYFALWVETTRGRSDARTDPFEEVQDLLERLSDSSAWWGQLARFGAGGLPYDDLIERAGDAGQHAEAHFYAGARKLTQGDIAEARRLFRRTLATNMVSFYEYKMAQELLAQTETSETSSSSKGSTPEAEEPAEGEPRGSRNRNSAESGSAQGG